jgi:hypothetical protein
MRRSPSRLLELQTTLASGVSDGLDTTVIEESAAVEYHRGDTGFLGSLGDQSANSACALRLDAALFANGRFEVAGGNKGATGNVIDELNVDVSRRAEHIQAGALCGPRHLGANANVASLSR